MTRTSESSQLGGPVYLLLGGAWGITVLIGLIVLYIYQTTPGNGGNPSVRWQISSQLVPTPNRLHLIMVAHPHCPCTRSSIEALARIMARSQNRVVASVLFPKSVNLPAGWEQTDLWQSASSIPGVRSVCDLNGDEAARFGLETSGHVLLFDERGQRIFSGGVTAGRGHCGDNAGLEQCLALINGKASQTGEAQVFGCALSDRLVGQIEGRDLCNPSN